MKSTLLVLLLLGWWSLAAPSALAHGPSGHAAPSLPPAEETVRPTPPPPVEPVAPPTPSTDHKHDDHAGHTAPSPAHDHAAPADDHDDHAGHAAPTDDHAGHTAPSPAHDHAAPADDHDDHAGHAAPTDDHAGHTAPSPTHDHAAPTVNHDDHAGHAAPTNEHAGHAMGGHGMGDGEGGMEMRHPGLPKEWILIAVGALGTILLWGLFSPPPPMTEPRGYNLATMPLLGPLVRFLNRTPWPLNTLKVVAVVVYLLVVVAGLLGTPHPERNLATVFVWNLWWPLVVVSVFFVGAAWCSICPWDTLSNWIVRRRLWKRRVPPPGLNRKVPGWLRNVWPALIMFMGLTWLELGVGVTSIPVATALMALVMLVLSVIFLALFERKAFCRYACPVGRTMGFYGRLAPVAVRPVEQKLCDTCRTMECYNGSEEIEPCPTHLTVGRFSQNTYCLSCGNCMLSCPYGNVSWRLRPMGSEAKSQARPHWDGAWFMLALLGITIFHGITMMPFWEQWVVTLARFIGESGQLMFSFTLWMFAGFLAPVVIYVAAVGLTWLTLPRETSFHRLFAAFPFSALPLAFVYHLAHNLDHLMREGGDTLTLFANPLGLGLEPLSAMERHERMMDLLFPEWALFTAQAGLMVLGFWLAVQIVRHRARGVLPGGGDIHGWRLTPMLAFLTVITAGNFWLLAQEMVMRF